MNFKFWFNNARPQALPQSVMPAIAAICWASMSDNFFLPIAIVALIGIVFAHLSVDLLDDYFDYKNAGIESREKLHRAGMRARIGKAPYLAEGQASLKTTFQVAALFGGIAILCGLGVFLYWNNVRQVPQGGWPMVIIAAIGGFLGFFYSARPFKLCYRGLGEVVTGIIFGPLLMAGMTYAAGGIIPAGTWLISTAIGLLVINILYTHSIMDAAPDISVGKKTLATLLGTPRRMLAGSFVFNFIPPVLLILCYCMGYFQNWLPLLAVLTLPMAVSLFRLMVQYVKETNVKEGTIKGSESGSMPQPSKAERRWWMGPMSNWKAIEEAGIDWFMIRWFLSRNYITNFVLVLAITFLIHR